MVGGKQKLAGLAVAVTLDDGARKRSTRRGQAPGEAENRMFASKKALLPSQESPHRFRAASNT